MTKNDFPSPLHKERAREREREARGHGRFGRLMTLPGTGTPETSDQPIVVHLKTAGEDKAAIRV